LAGIELQGAVTVGKAQLLPAAGGFEARVPRRFAAFDATKKGGEGQTERLRDVLSLQGKL
jgi:hypothetical protein